MSNLAKHDLNQGRPDMLQGINYFTPILPASQPLAGRMRLERMDRSKTPCLKVLNMPEPAVDIVLDTNGRMAGQGPAPGSKKEIEDIFDELPGDLELKTESPMEPLQFGLPSTLAQAADMTLAPRPVLEHTRNPWAWWTVGDLFTLCGPLLTGFLLLQMASAVAVAVLVSKYSGTQPYFLAGTLALIALIVDGVVIKAHHGTHYTRIYQPLARIATLTIVPGIFALVWLKLVMLD